MFTNNLINQLNGSNNVDELNSVLQAQQEEINLNNQLLRQTAQQFGRQNGMSNRDIQNLQRMVNNNINGGGLNLSNRNQSNQVGTMNSTSVSNLNDPLSQLNALDRSAIINSALFGDSSSRNTAFDFIGTNNPNNNDNQQNSQNNSQNQQNNSQNSQNAASSSQNNQNNNTGNSQNANSSQQQFLDTLLANTDITPEQRAALERNFAAANSQNNNNNSSTQQANNNNTSNLNQSIFANPGSVSQEMLRQIQLQQELERRQRNTRNSRFSNTPTSSSNILTTTSQSNSQTNSQNNSNSGNNNNNFNQTLQNSLNTLASNLSQSNNNSNSNSNNAALQQLFMNSTTHGLLNAQNGVNQQQRQQFNTDNYLPFNSDFHQNNDSNSAFDNAALRAFLQQNAGGSQGSENGGSARSNNNSNTAQGAALTRQQQIQAQQAQILQSLQQLQQQNNNTDGF